MIVSIVVVIVLDWNFLGDSRRRTGNTSWTGSHSIIVVYLIVLVFVFPFYLMAPSSEINNVNKKHKKEKVKINTVLKGLLKWSKMFNNELARLIPEVKC